MNSAVDVWVKVQEILKNDLTATAINTWFDDCNAVEISGNRLIVHTPTKYKKDVIEGRFLGTIKSALQELFSSDEDFEVLILDDNGLKAMSAVIDENNKTTTEKYTFQNFVVGNTNKFAHATALAVADGKTDFNPLFLYGESGVGKSHLLCAIRHAVETKFPHYKIVYVNTEDFVNELVQAIKKGENVQFREKYRGTDFILLDDIQFIVGKPFSQEEFYHTFDTLHQIGKQIVLASDRPPSDMLTLENRIKGRFESGILVEIEPPDEVLRRAIIKSKAEELGTIIPPDVTDYIADNLDSSVRQLECVVKMIIAYRDIMNEDITVDNVKARLKDIFKGERELVPTASDIIEYTANYFNLTPEEIKGKDRQAHVVLARHTAMYLVKKITNLTPKEIGKEFDGMDRTSVMHGDERVKLKIAEDKDFGNKIKDITMNINSKKLGT